MSNLLNIFISFSRSFSLSITSNVLFAPILAILAENSVSVEPTTAVIPLPLITPDGFVLGLAPPNPLLSLVLLEFSPFNLFILSFIICLFVFLISSFNFFNFSNNSNLILSDSLSKSMPVSSKYCSNSSNNTTDSSCLIFFTLSSCSSDFACSISVV